MVEPVDLDVHVDDLEAAEAAILELGASKHHHQPETTFRVFLDPAGLPSASAQGLHKGGRAPCTPSDAETHPSHPRGLPGRLDRCRPPTDPLPMITPSRIVHTKRRLRPDGSRPPSGRSCHTDAASFVSEISIRRAGPCSHAARRRPSVNVSSLFDVERPRLIRLAAGVLGDRHEAEDIVQKSWLRLSTVDADAIVNLPAWLTTVTTRLCLDRLRAKVPEPVDSTAYPYDGVSGGGLDPLAEVELADTVGVALHIVLETLTPSERVAFILHDTFSVEFDTVAQVLDTSPAAARKLASRARAKIADRLPEGPAAEWEVVDAFLDAARSGDFARLLHLLAPGVVVTADAAAVSAGTPARLEGRDAVASMFDGAARGALPWHPQR